MLTRAHRAGHKRRAASRDDLPDLVTRQASRLLAETRWRRQVVLGSRRTCAPAAIARAHSHVPLVLDPVLASGRGDRLATDAARVALIEALVPCATVVTPNTLEADSSAACVRCSSAAAATCFHRHACEDRRCGEPAARYGRHGARGPLAAPAGSYHGSGCTLASAVAALLAHGRDVAEAVAPRRTSPGALSNAFSPGAGQAIPNRFFQR